MSRLTASDFVAGYDGGVVAPAFGVAGGAVDNARGRGVGQGGGGDLIVDSPAGVVVEGFASPGPPGVGARALAAEVAAQVDPAGFEERVEPGAFFGEEAALLAV